jgi:hypothetical protein
MAEVGKKTGKQTQAGRDVYETPEGEMVSEKSTTIEYKGKWINIPTIHGGKQYSEDELMEMLDKGLIKPTSAHNKLEEAIQAAQSRSDSLEFNKGGTPMLEKQMELFEDGGLRDEGGMVDEVSGNDVPVGSTRKEVRDDIPAMLSEGEFVFPADVVRYIGLENLMRIRQDAKQGLKQMDAMGQMGNGDEAVIPDDMPFGVMDLIIVDGEDEPQEKAQGGVIHANQGTFVTPMFDPSNQDVREYKNAEGNSLFIPFFNGEPVYPIPTGYSPAGQAPVETETEQAIPVSDDSDPPPPPPQSEFQKAGGFGMDTSATDGKALATWIKEAERAGTVGNVVAGIAAAINPLIGGAVVLANKKQKQQIISMLDEKISQAQNTPIAGQVKALRDLKTRLTTDEGKGILSKVVGGIVDTVSDALGLGEEEKKKAKVNTVVNASSDSNEPDDATDKKIDIVDKTAGGTQDPDALADALATADEAAIAGSTLKEDGTYDISSWYSADDLEATGVPTEPELPRVREITTNGQLIKSEDGDLLRTTLPQIDSNQGMQYRENRIDEPPTVAMPEEPTVPSLTEPNTLPIRTSLMQDKARATIAANAPATTTTAVDDLRKSIADLSYDESRATAMSSLSGFGEDASSQAIKSYLEKAMDNVDTIVKGSDTDTTTTPTTTAPVQGGGDDDGPPSFASVGDNAKAAQQASKDVTTTVQKDDSGNVTGVTTTGGTSEQQQTMQDYVTSAAAGAKGGLFTRRKKKKK